ncbi:MarR family winged helix-turn-helix transcriptional regulator [Streptomyces wuyuanensis]|uniref:DNA-binding transcriptional regulator, MarR family n=1 Tax=Streptomyces wuyuanensis TaxID=1196353 RepID=A0A1G9TYW2_9ACTN|nr:MarR family transcriptional regulator [Streptomyces wuyuanensis]SDM52856.1 DNA-binding transcriptional regulator, MarR family [Streptomyces wuyuanensis]
MADTGESGEHVDDVEAVTRAVLTASRLLVAVSARSLAAVEDRVTLPQLRLLVMLSMHGPAKLVVLAERLGVNPSTAMRMLDRLIAVGLAERRTNPANRRETVLRLTHEGRVLVEDVTSRRRREVETIVARMAPDRRAALIDALTAFNEAGGEPAVPAADGAMYPLGWTDAPLPQGG